MKNLYQHATTGALRVANQSPRIGHRDGGEWNLLRADVTSREECEMVARLAYTYGGAYPERSRHFHWAEEPALPAFARYWDGDDKLRVREGWATPLPCPYGDEKCSCQLDALRAVRP